MYNMYHDSNPYTVSLNILSNKIKKTNYDFK